jgi:ABC-type sulfate transport system permease component
MKFPLVIAHGGIELLLFVLGWLLLANGLGICACVAAARKKKITALACGVMGLILGLLLLRAYNFRAPQNVDSFLAWLSIPTALTGIAMAVFQKPKPRP